MLFVEAILLIELLHFAVHDFLDHRFRLACGTRLFPVDLALVVEDFRRNFFPPHITRIERRDVHRQIVAQLLEIVGAGHEIGFAIHFHHHADFSAGVNVVADQSFAGFALRLLLRRGLALAPQNIDGALDVAFGFHQRVAAIVKTGARAFAQVLYELRGYINLFRVCRHFGKSSDDDQNFGWITEPGTPSSRDQDSDSPSACTVCSELVTSGASTKSPSCFS